MPTTRAAHASPRDRSSTDVHAPEEDLERLAFAALALCDPSDEVHCSLTVVPASRAPETVAATDHLPVRADWLQHELGQGPALMAHPGESLAIDDLAADERWPDFGKMCVATMNLRSMLSVGIPLAAGDTASLNVYSSEPEALDRMDVAAASKLARLAAAPLTDLLSALRGRLQGPPDSDYSRTAIAVHTIGAIHSVDDSEAFNLLCSTSHDLHRAMLDVAIQTAADGDLPKGAEHEPESGRGSRSAEPKATRSHRRGADLVHST